MKLSTAGTESPIPPKEEKSSTATVTVQEKQSECETKTINTGESIRGSGSLLQTISNMSEETALVNQKLSIDLLYRKQFFFGL